VAAAEAGLKRENRQTDPRSDHAGQATTAERLWDSDQAGGELSSIFFQLSER
jgi:hypothetical protein